MRAVVRVIGWNAVLPPGGLRKYRGIYLLLLVSLGLLACQEELTPRTTVDSLRVLGIQASPPELSPGTLTRVSALVADPLGQGRSLDWFITLCTPDTVHGGCLEYNALLDIYPDESVAQSEYTRCCVRAGSVAPQNGIAEIGGPTTWLKTGWTYLDGMSELVARQGTNAQLNFIVCADGACVPASGEDPETAGMTLPPGLSAVALKRIRVSSAPVEEANDNPGLTGILMGPQHFGPDDVLELEAGKTYTLQPEVSSTAIECYVSVKSDGTQTQAIESPYFSWYANGGSFADYFTEPTPASGCDDETTVAERLEHAANTWTTPLLNPGDSPDITLTVVMWDRRGGLTWMPFAVHLQSPSSEASSRRAASSR